MVKINILITLKINKMLAAIWGALILEKWRILCARVSFQAC